MPDYDAILVPGGGVREGGELPAWVRRRLDLAAELFDGRYIITLSAGTVHRPPPLDPRGFPIFESVAGAQYLLRAGVPLDRILTETCSYDTIGNAYFARILHTDPLGLRRLLVITSDYHLPRTELAFTWVYRLTPLISPCELHFRGVADQDMDPSILKARREREQKSLESLNGLARRLTTIQDFHRWLFTEHTAYNSQAGAFRENSVAGDLLRSY